MNAGKAVILSEAQRSRRIPSHDREVLLQGSPTGSLDFARDDECGETMAHPRAIEVHIEELVLHGFRLRDRWEIGDAVEQELARLLGEQGIAFSLLSENATDELKAPTFNAALGAKPPAIGRQIAQAVYTGFSQ